ncbi:MAG TPA: PLP-dependent aminotransferase family protein [Afipia sp.]
MKRKRPGTLLITLDENNEAQASLVLRLRDRIQGLIWEGAISDGERLPSTRALARDLGISRETVEAAYQQLDSEGFVVRRTGSGTFASRAHKIAIDDRKLPQKSSDDKTTEGYKPAGPIAVRGTDIIRSGGIVDQSDVHPFVAAMPDVETFPIDVWQQLTSRTLRNHSRKLLMYGDAQGYEPLRIEIWKYLTANRGIRCDPDQILVLSSSQQALTLIGIVLINPGDIVAVENPGYHGAKLALLAADAYLKPVSVDADGIVVENIEDTRGPVRAVYVTPSHQYPTGVTLSLERRIELLKWAASTRGWIIEDDYDSEYRYDSRPLPSIQGLDQNGNVLYLGTFNKVLFPSLRIAYLVLPRPLVRHFVAARTLLDGQSPVITQAVLQAFMFEGHFTAHIRQMRELYHGRRDLFSRSLATHLSRFVHAVTPPGGLSVACYLKDGLNEKRTIDIARSIGIELPSLRRLYLGNEGRDGWLLGFAALAPEVAANAMQRLASILPQLDKI